MKHPLYNTLCLFTALQLALFSNVTNAQDRLPCGTTEAIKKGLENNPEAAKKLAELEVFTQNFGKYNKSENNSPKIIPVVFHIIHKYGSENVPASRVLAAMKMINEDFRKKNADTVNIVSAFKGVAGDSNIEFRLAKIDPNGNCTDGITRTVSDFTFAADENVKDLISWNTTTQKYLQIWVVASIASGAGGYSNYPGIFSTKYEGVVIRNAQMADRSLTHEIGHYLNLAHTWGDSNDPGLQQNCGMDDHVSDTPNTIGHTKCDLYTPSCGSPIDNVQNYMEYSFCDLMFTKGQGTRMNAALNSSVGDRDNLWSSANLIATGTNAGYIAKNCAPVPDFAVENTIICEGGKVTFTDLSWNSDSIEYNWVFPGGTPSSSNLKNPVIQYNTSGVYNVTLNVKNSGGTKSKTKTNVVNVSSKSSAVPMDSFSEGFETLTISGSEWMINNPDGKKTWSIINSAGYNSSRSMIMNNYGNAEGEIDEFITPQFDFSNTSRPALSFRLSCARRSTTNDDQLRISASTDCGEKWTVKYSKKGSQLANVGIVSTSFKPSNSSQWRVDSILNLQAYAGSKSVRFKFEFTSDGGNNLYIDNINLDNATSISEEKLNRYFVNVFPNPANENASVFFSLKTDKKVSMEIMNILGKTVSITKPKNYGAGEHTIAIERGDIPSGNYFIKLLIDDEPVIRKLVLQ